MKYRSLARPSSTLSIALLFLFVTFCADLQAFAQNSKPRTPTETVRDFYRMMHERHFREAFALSIYKPAIDGLTDAEFKTLRPEFKNLSDKQFEALRPNYESLSAEEFEDLRPDFERMAAAIPDKIEVSGEQMSGNIATVFVRIADADKAAEAEPIGLMRDSGGIWIIGDRENQEIVKKAGKQFFFEARINAHHNEVQAMLQRISLAQLAYAAQHNNLYADLPTLIKAGLIPKDIETPDTTGYRFHLAITKDAKRWAVSAEPARYNRTGRLSFLLDQTGIRSADVKGKPFIPTAEQVIEVVPK